MAKKDRLSRIRNARSVAEISAIVAEIKEEVEEHESQVKKLQVSLSAGDEITFDQRGGKRKPARDAAFKPPRAAAIKRHMAVLEDLHDNYTELEASLALVKQSFPTNKAAKAVIDSINTLMESVSESLNDAFDALALLSENHLPAKFATMADNIISYLLKVLPANSYDDLRHESYINLGEDSSFVFCTYISAINLKKDNYVYDAYYFVLTGHVDKEGNQTMFLNAFPTFKIPGLYPEGKEIHDRKGAELRTALLLSHAGFSAKVEKMPLPVEQGSEGRLGLTNIKGVTKASISKEDELVVTLDPNIRDSAVNNVIKDVMARLCAVYRGNPNKTHFVYKKGTQKQGGEMSQVLRFHLVPDGQTQNTHADLAKLDDFARDFGLDDKQKKALRFAVLS